VTRRASKAAVVLTAMIPLALCEDIDPTALLNRARAKIVANVEKLPKYTCLQTIRRSRFQMIPAGQVRGCGKAEFSSTSIQPQLTLAWTDRLKLDVTTSEGQEIFSWAGARQFQSDDVQDIIGGGMTGTGDFGGFITSVFASHGSLYDYLGLAIEAKGHSLAMYRYHVPVSTSTYQMRTGPAAEDVVTMAYEGKFWIDPETAELTRMTVEVPKPPRGSGTCRAETTIDYQRARIGSSDFLLPQLTVLRLWTVEAEVHENRTVYASCRAFESESVFRTDAEPADGAASEAPKKPVVILPGVTIKIALRSKIDSENSFAGDAIDGQLLNPIGKAVPKGAIVRGRIVRFEHEYQPSNYFALGLKFHSIEVNGTEVPLTLALRNRGSTILGGSIEKRPGIGTFIFQADKLVLDQTFVSEWKTAGREF